MDYKKENNQRNLMSYRQANGMGTFSITLTKKCERLATAIYLVTNFLPDNEPMKARLRALSLDFVRDASLLKNGCYGVETNVLDTLRFNILETLSLLELAFVAGLVSEMNFTVLKREYSTLRDTIEIKKTSRESCTDSVLGDNFFGSTFHAAENISSTNPAVSSLQGVKHRSGNPSSILASSEHSSAMSFKVSDRNIENNVSKKSSASNKIHEPMSDSSTHVRAITNVQKESRRARILKLVKDNREVTIKDIANHFPGLSEKTIQRELMVLVDTNVLKKSGERRWSKYTLL